MKTIKYKDKDISIKTKKRWERERMNRGFCKYDASNLQDWFTEVVPKMISVIKHENYRQTPAAYFIKYVNNSTKYTICKYSDFYELNLPLEESEEIHKKCQDDYLNTLDKLIYFLSNANPESCHQTNKYKDDYDMYVKNLRSLDNALNKKRDKTDMLLNVKNKLIAENEEMVNNYIKRENEIKEYRQKCLIDGLKLFSENIESLEFMII